MERIALFRRKPRQNEMSIRRFEANRAVEIKTSSSYGTGYRIGGHLVLTVAHLFAENGIGSPVDFRLWDSKDGWESDAHVVWCAPNADAALVQLPERILPVEPCEFGRISAEHGPATIRFEFYGWPEWAQTITEKGSRQAGGRHIEGTIHVNDRSPDGYIVLEPDRAPWQREKGERGSPWQGTSGAAVLCEGFVVAIQRWHQRPDRTNSLEAEPIERFWNDKRFIALLSQHGIPTKPHSLAQHSTLRKSVECLQSHVLRLMRGTVYNLGRPVLPIEVTDTPDAVAIPFTYQSRRILWSDTTEEAKKETFKSFGNFLEAFEYHDKRVLLLGEPGSGKTTTLLTLALQKIDDWLRSNSVLLPIFAEIWTWDGKATISEWLAQSVNLDVDFLRMEIISGRVLLLLDGLDELQISDSSKSVYDYQAEFINAVSRLGKTPVAMTCRVTDYEVIVRQAATKITLDGAVTMNPLLDEQIELYLQGEPNLWKLLQDDDELRNALRTPILLTLFFIAYRDIGQETSTLHDLRNSPGELRGKIFDAYIKRRFEFEQARYDHSLPFSLTQIYGVLGEALFRELGDRSNWMDVLRWEQSGSIVAGETDYDNHDGILTSVDEFDNHDDIVLPADEFDLQNYFAQDEHSVKSRRDFTIDIFDKLLGPKASEFIALVVDLQLLRPSTDGNLGFTHLLLRDHFAFHYCSPRVFDVDTGTRYSAAKVLGRIRDTRGIRPLIELLRDDDYRIRWRARQSIIAIGDPVVESLLALLQDQNDEVRLVAVIGLGRIRATLAIESLVRLASESSDSIVARQAGIELIQSFHDVRGMHQYLQASDRIIRKSDHKGHDQIKSAYTLAALGNKIIVPLIKALRYFRDTSSPVWSLAKITLLTIEKRTGKFDVKPLADALANPSESTVIRLWAAEVLADIQIGDNNLVESITFALTDPDPWIRLVAGYTLIRQGNAQAISPFLIAFGSIHVTFDDKFLDNITEALAKMDSLLVEPLIAAMYELAPHSTQNQQFWTMARKLLTRIGEPSSKPLVDMLMTSDRSSLLFGTALLVLGTINNREKRVIDILIEVLVDRHEKSPVRNAAAMAMAQLARLAIKATVELFSSCDPDVRHYSAWILGQIKDKSTAKSLIKALLDESDHVRAQAAMSLGMIESKRAIKPLIGALGDRNWNVRYHAVQALGELGDLRVIEHLVKLLNPDVENEENKLVADVAAFTLVTLGDARGIERCIKVLRDVQPDDEKEWMEVNTKRFSRIGEPAIKPLVNSLLSKEFEKERLWHLSVKSLGQIGEPAIRFLAGNLQHDQEEVRLQIAKVLGEIEGKGLEKPRFGPLTVMTPNNTPPLPSNNLLNPFVIHSLINALEDSSWQVQAQAIKSLLTFGKAISEPLLILLTNPTKRGRFAAAWALGELKDVRALDPLLTLIDDEDVTLRYHVVQALGRIAARSNFSMVETERATDTRLVNALVERLRDPVVDVQREAATSLGLMGDKRAADHLVAILDNCNSEVNMYVAQALVQLGDPRGIEAHLGAMSNEILTNKDALQTLKSQYARFGDDALAPLLAVCRNLYMAAEANHEETNYESFSNRLKVVRILVEQIGEPVIEPLLKMLTDRHEMVRMREFAASIIATIEHKLFITKDVDLFIDLLHDEYELLRFVAAEALGWLDDNRAFMPLIDLFRSADVYRRVVGTSLDRMSGVPAFSVLLELLSDTDHDVRAYAARKIGHYQDKRAIIPLTTLLDDSSLIIRSQAAWALIELGHPEAAKNLILSIALVIDEISEDGINDITDSLSRYGENVVQPLLDYLFDTDDRKEKVINFIVKVLDKIGQPAIEQLIELVQHGAAEDLRDAVLKAMDNRSRSH